MGQIPIEEIPGLIGCCEGSSDSGVEQALEGLKTLGTLPPREAHKQMIIPDIVAWKQKMEMEQKKKESPPPAPQTATIVAFVLVTNNGNTGRPQNDECCCRLTTRRHARGRLGCVRRGLAPTR